MNFLFRAVLILLAFAFVVYVLKAIARLSFNLRGAIKDLRRVREQMAGRPAANAEMVRCASCGAFVSSRDALTVSSRNRSLAFCSQSCMRAKVAS
ncbi:MAG: hypothetical protein ACREEM_10655 [Blastocatellia bacterium]